MAIIPDDKNWTWVLERPCADCGLDPSTLDARTVGSMLRANAAEWTDLLAHPDAQLRPSGDQWSALEYGCHVRDVFRLFDERLRLMLTEDGPRFANWDQDETALADRYDQQDPVGVAADLVAAAAVLADRFDGVTDDQWPRTGFRSDGAAFTVDSFARYFIHDPVHHVDDVLRGNEILAAGSLDT